MSKSNLQNITNVLQTRITDHCKAAGVPGYLAGVCHRGHRLVLAHGVTNVTTQDRMREDTGFLIGSITKLFTTTLILRQAELGVIDLEERVVTYLPEFRLTDPVAAAKIRVRHLLTHTNGIDADLLFPDAWGQDALKVFLESLALNSGALFEPGEFISYSNGGMILAGRLLEVVTGLTYHELLRRDVYDRVGMKNSCTSAVEAILRSTAVGHFPDQEPARARRTNMFMLPESWAPAGSSPVSTIDDLLSFGQTQIGKGLSPIGKQMLSARRIAQMQAISFNMQTPNVPPMGLGWVLLPFGKTTVLTHSGASPGGVAVLAVIPGHDFVFAAFGNDGRAMALHDQLLLGLLREYLQIEVPELLQETAPIKNLKPYAGTYRSNQLRIDVSVVGDQLEEVMTYEPLDEVQKTIFTSFTGGALPVHARRFIPVRKDLFAPAGMPLHLFNGYSRQLLVSYHNYRRGKMEYRCAGGRMTRRD